jgi:hypothetical protein
MTSSGPRADNRSHRLIDGLAVMKSRAADFLVTGACMCARVAGRGTG